MQRVKFIAFLKFILLFLVAVGCGYLFFKGYYPYAILLSIVAVFLFYNWFSQQLWMYQQLFDFSEATKYHDFTRNYAIRNKKSLEGKLFSAFNQINQEFKNIHSDKEIQNQYLNKVINMLDSGIVFYQLESGKVIWINDAFKNLFKTPHLGNLKGLQKRHPDLYEKTIALKIGKQQIETADSSKGKIKLLIQTSEFETKDGVFRIVHYQNINEAMDETEAKAYHKLLRVLTHEIMNSIAPISSLADTMHERLLTIENRPELDDVKVGIRTIKKRSEGLLQFSKSYRMLNKIDQPNLSEVPILQLLENVNQLLEPVMLRQNIEFDVIVKNTKMLLHVDANLIEQVLINLLLNAIEAVKGIEHPRIILSALELDDKIQLKIQDNGAGISPELQEQIFTPFFTTKKTGSGIGLTLTKQIMLVHKGSIFVQSDEGVGSTFTLNFLK